MNANVFTVPGALFRAVVAVCMLGGPEHRVSAQCDLNQLTVDYQSRRRQLIHAYHQQRDALRFRHQSELDRFRLAQVGAARLCGQARAAALRQIAWQRREAIERYHIRLRELARQHHWSLRQLDAWYREARRGVVTYRVPTPPGLVHPSGPAHLPGPAHPPHHRVGPATCRDRCGPVNSGFSLSLGRGGLRIGVASAGAGYHW